MFYKLALSNVRKSIKEYIVYFLTLAFGVCLFYAFNSIDSQKAMLEVSKSHQQIIEALIKIIGYISIFISVILGFLILYANKFLIKRRKKEFGIYMTLGMKKIRISRIVIIETLIIGLFSLVVGLIVGVALSQLLSVVTAKMFEVNLASLHFVFSITALKKTILYFGIIFLVVMIFNTISISRHKLIDLIYANKKNEKLRFKNMWIPVLIFLASVACLGYAYYRILHYGLMEFDTKLLITVILGSIGTILFFMSLAGFLLKIVQSNKKVYFKNLNMFVLRQINSKINTNFISMSMVCLMLFVTIGTLAGGMAISSAYSSSIKGATPFDASIVIENAKKDTKFNVINTLKDSKIDLSDVVGEYTQIRGYSSDKIKYSNILSGIEGSKKEYMEYLNKMPVMIIGLSDFNKTIKMQGKEELKLNDNEFFLLCNVDDAKKYCNNYLKEDGKLNINSKNIKSATNEVIDYTLQDGMGKQDTAVIVQDNELEGYVPDSCIFNANYIGKDKKYEKQFTDIFDSDNKGSKLISGYGITRQIVYDQSVGLKVMMTYLAIYIGIIFLITSAAVLALQQLSEAADNIERYDLLKKIGAEKSMINKALFTQICIYFLVPLSLAIVHSIVGIKVIDNAIVMLGKTGMFTNILSIAALIVVVYGGYLFATFIGAKNMIKAK